MRTTAEIEAIRCAGLVVWQAHQAAAQLIGPGVTTAEIDAVVEQTIVDNLGVPLFKGQPGKVPFPAATCTSVNEEIVHGIPGERKLQAGDLISIDIGVKLDGWCSDAATTHPVGTIDAPRQRLLSVTEGALRLAIGMISNAVKWSEVAGRIQSHVERAGFSVVEELAGHGIGRQMWEPPQLPNYWNDGMQDVTLSPGMVFAIEPMVNMGGRDILLKPDMWTIFAADRKPSAHFEHTIAITEDGPRIMTAGPDGEAWAT